jgi:kynurenine formamidase
MPVYPGDPQPKFEAYSTIRDDKVNVARITIGSHTGTHVDAGWHFLPNGKGIDKEPLSKFIGEAIIIDVSDKRGEGITAKDLEVKAGNSRLGDIMLLYTGTGSSCTNFTYVDVPAAQWIVDRGIKCLGTDTLSVEKFGVKDAPTHKLLLSKDIGIIENLDKLEQFVNKRMFLVCLPLLLEGLDGSPARAVLFEMIK